MILDMSEPDSEKPIELLELPAIVADIKRKLEEDFGCPLSECNDPDLLRLKNNYMSGNLIRHHFTFGTQIRNTYHLWYPEHPAYKLYQAEGGHPESPYHPDQYSFKIIEQLCLEIFGPINFKSSLEEVTAAFDKREEQIEPVMTYLKEIGD